MEALLEDLKSSHTDVQKRALIRFTVELRREVPADLNFLDQSIETLCNMVSLSDQDIAHLALQLLAEVVAVRVPLPRPLLQKVVMALLSRFVESKASVRMYAVDILNHCARASPDAAVELLLGLGSKSSEVTSSQDRVKTQMLQVFQQLLRMENGLAQEKQALKRSVIQVAALVADSVVVSSAAKETLQKLYEILGDTELSSLPLSARSAVAIEVIKQTGTQIQASVAAVVPASPASPVYNPEPSTDMVFNVISPETHDALRQDSTWKEKEDALEILGQALAELDSAKSIHNPQDLVDLFGEILGDRNFKVTTSCLKVIKKMIAHRGLSKFCELQALLPALLTKLGDNKISVRRGVFGVLLLMVRELRPENLFGELLSALEEPNWHVKEELMHVFIATMLSIDDNYQYDFLELAPHLAKLLDDPKTKIRHVATETLAVLAHVTATEVVLKRLEPLVDYEALNLLEERFKVKALPIIRGDSVEFPRSIPSSAPVISSPYITKTDFARPSGEDKSPPPARAGPRPRPPGSAKPTSRAVDIPPPQSLAMTQELRHEFFEKPKPLFAPRRLLDQGIRSSSIEPLASTRRVTGLRRAIPATVIQTPEPKSAFSALTQPEKRYLTPSELGPAAIKPSQVIELLESKDWADQFEGLNSVRKLIKNDIEQFSDIPFMHAVLIATLRLADSLRSSLAKNAMIVLGEACEQLNRLLDPDLDLVAAIFLKKCSETNAFLAEESNNSLIIMCNSCTEARVLTAILNGVQASKAVATKAKAAQGLETVRPT